MRYCFIFSAILSLLILAVTAFFFAGRARQAFLSSQTAISLEDKAWRLKPYPVDSKLQHKKSVIGRALKQYNLVTPNSLSAKCHKLATLALWQEWRSSESMQDQLADLMDRSKRETSGRDSIFILTKYGPMVRQIDLADRSDDLVSELHRDQVLAALAEAGVPCTRKIKAIHTADISVANLLETSRRLFVLEHEPYWSIIAYCHYLPSGRRWKDRFKNTVSYDDICNALLLDVRGDSNCFGTHRLYCIAMLLQLNDSHSILSGESVRLANKTIDQCSRQLERNQLSEGAWDRLWMSTNGRSHQSPMDEMMTVTAHHLDWIAYASPSHRPKEETILKAVYFLLRSLDSLATKEYIRNNYCTISHALRAILNLSSESSFPFLAS